MKVLRKRDHLDSVPDRWRRQYANLFDRYPEKVEISLKLDKLEKGVFSAQDVEYIIGNKSWTEHECDLCEKDYETLIRIGDDPDHDARWLDVCEGCLRKALHMAMHEYP